MRRKRHGLGWLHEGKEERELVSVVYHDDLKEVQEDGVVTAMLRAPIAAAPFDRAAWWQALADHCALPPLIAVVTDGPERMVLPLMRESGQVRTLANWYSFRVAPLFTPAADRERLATALARDLAVCTARLALFPLPDEQGEAELLTAALRRTGWQTFCAPCDVNHLLSLNGRSFAAYLAARPGQLRTTLKRKAGKVAVELATHFDPGLWADYEAVYAASWKPQEGSPEFLRAFAEADGAEGRLRMAVARADGQPIAAQVWTVEHGTAFIHKLAHTKASSPLSPGTTLLAALLEQVIDHDQVNTVDFGTGDDAYKRDWMESVRPRFRIDAYRPGAPRNWLPIAKARLRNLLQRG